MAIFSAVIFCFAALDHLTGDHLGMGPAFRQGFQAVAELFLIMTGFMALAPWIAEHVAPAIAPALTAIGCDPSLFAGTILACDTGGAVLAGKIALDPQAGLYNGMIVAASLGDMICGGIPMALMKVKGSKLAAAVNGLLIAFVVLPFGCFFTGLLCGFPIPMMLRNTWPVAVIGMILLVLFRYCSAAMIPFFSGFALALRGVSLFGFCTAVLQEATGTVWLEGLTPLDEIFPVICHIGVFLGGILPFFALVQRMLSKPISRLCGKLAVQPKALTDIIVTTANSVPVLLTLEELQEREITFVVAYAMLTSFTVGDFLAFAMQYAPQIALPMMFGRLAAGTMTLIASAALLRKKK